MWLYLIQGIGFGLAAAAQPGPFQAYLLSQTMQNGWRRTLPAAFAPLISDGPIILLALLLLSRIPAWLQRGLYLAGGLFILYLAWSAWRAWRAFDAGRWQRVGPSQRQSVWHAALMNALNPGPYIYWSLVTGPILLNGWQEAPISGAAFLFGFYATLVGALVGIILLFGLARPLGPAVNRALLGISALALGVFGLLQVYRGLA